MAKEKKELIVGVNGDLSDNFTTGQKAVLGLQNTLAMCGVILVPILCGLDVSVTLFCAGIGTIIYQFIDKKMVPAFLGGSFAIIAGVSTVVGEMGIPYAQGGILGMAVFYLLFALLLKILGKDRVARPSSWYWAFPSPALACRKPRPTGPSPSSPSLSRLVSITSPRALPAL